MNPERRRVLGFGLAAAGSAVLPAQALAHGRHAAGHHAAAHHAAAHHAAHGHHAAHAALSKHGKHASHLARGASRHHGGHADSVPPVRLARLSPSGGPRRAYVHNLHTGDVLNAVYYENGRYVPDALAAAMNVLRDWRNGEEHTMDPGLFDVLHAVGERLDVRTPFQIISGYRSPATNAMMHERSCEVASKSQHLLGKALDIRVQGVELRNLHRAALSLGAGGVGYYPESNFVHVDVGPVRQWSGA